MERRGVFVLSPLVILVLTLFFFLILLTAFSEEVSAALLVAVGNFTKSTANAPTEQAITGLGFTPKVVIFFFTNQSADGFSRGFDMGFGFSNASFDEGAAISSDDHSASSNTGRRRSTRSSIIILNESTPSLAAEGNITSMDADGFTVGWIMNDAAPTIINYIALGGTDIRNVNISQFRSAEVAGSQSIAGVGFQPDFVMFLYTGTEVEERNTASILFGMGFARSSGSQASIGLCSPDNEAKTISAQIQNVSAVISGFRTDCSTLWVGAAFTSMDSDGFTITVDYPPSVPTYILFLALKGGQYNVSNFTLATSVGSQQVSRIGFTPKGLILTAASGMLNAFSNSMNLSFGASSATARRAIWGTDPFNLLDTNTSIHLNLTSIFTSATYGDTPVKISEANLSSFASNSFTLDWTIVDTAIRNAIFVAVGDEFDPFAGNASINRTAMNLNEWICLNATASDPQSDPITVTANVWNTTFFSNYTMTDTGTSCSNIASDNIYGVEIQGIVVGTWNFSNLIVNDSLAHFNQTIVNLQWNVTSLDSLPPYITFISPTPKNASNQSSTTVTINTTVFDSSSNIGSCYLSWALVGDVFANYSMTKTANSGSNSNVTCNYTQISLSDGNYIYKIIANDTTSNGNETNVQQVTIDSIAPFIDYTGLTTTNNTNSNRNYIYINITSSDAVTGVANLTFILVNITNSFMTELNRTFVYANLPNTTLNFTSLADGTYLYNVTASDYVGNKNTTERRTIIIDTIAPHIEFISPLNQTYTTSNITVNISSTGSYTWWNNATGASNQTYTSFFTLAVANGQYTFRAYANDSASNENSTSVTFVVNVVAEAPGAGAGGGGGGGGVTRVPAFSVDKEVIKIILKTGETKIEKITISNTGQTDLDFEIDIENVEKFLALSENKFRLKQGESKELTLVFTASEQEKPEVFSGRLIINSDSLANLAEVVILVIEVKERKPIFDIKVNLPEKFKEVKQGDSVGAEIMMFNLGDVIPVDVNLFYSLRDTKGNDILFEEETLKVEEQKLVKRSLKVPKDLDSGWYLFYTKISYGNATASSSSLFKVEKKTQIPTYMYALLVLVILFISFLARKKLEILFKELSDVLHKEATIIFENFSRLRMRRVADEEAIELRKAIKETQRLIEDAKFIEAKKTILDAKAKLYEHMNEAVREDYPEIEERIDELEKELEIFIAEEKERIDKEKELSFSEFLSKFLKKSESIENEEDENEEA